jgi:dTDP-4-amino-4,6-dideoxygalactose transaminase
MISVFGSKVGQEEINNVVDCMQSQWMGFGGNVAKFEEKFAHKFGLNNFAMVDSGSNALYMAVTLLDLPKGSEIILPSFTWVSCAQAILLAGHIPVFCDVDIKTMNVRRVDIEPHITPKTRAIMVVHYAGLPVDMDSIIELGFPIIEDAAHAVDSYHKGKLCGSIADIGIYSFDAVKNLTVGEGGGITAKNAELIERAKILRYCGIGKSGFESAMSSAKGKNRWWEYNIKEPFIKMLPTNIAGAIGIAQLDNIDELQRYRKTIWEIYQNEFKDIGWIIRPLEEKTGDKHSYFTYCIRIPKRDELAHYLLENKIYTTLRYHPLHMNSLYGQTAKRLINCEQLNDDCLSIPLHPRLTKDDVEKIVLMIKNFEKYL